MKSNHILNNLDEISFDQAIFSNKIYRKICNLDESYSVYSLIFMAFIATIIMYF